MCGGEGVYVTLQEYELAYYDSAIHRFNHYTTRTPQRWYKVEDTKITFKNIIIDKKFLVDDTNLIKD